MRRARVVPASGAAQIAQPAAENEDWPMLCDSLFGLYMGYQVLTTGFLGAETDLVAVFY